MFGEEEVEISELRSTPCKRKAEEKFVTPSSRRRVLPSFKKKTREAKKEGVRESTRERGRERDKGNTGLASTQFPSLASNFRRILPSHSILPLYQRVSLHLSQALSSPFLNRYLHPRLSLSPYAHGESRASPQYPNRLFLSPSTRPTKSRDSRLKYTVSALSPPIAIWLVNWGPLNICVDARKESERLRERTDLILTSTFAWLRTRQLCEWWMLIVLSAVAYFYESYDHKSRRSLVLDNVKRVHLIWFWMEKCSLKRCINIQNMIKYMKYFRSRNSLTELK